MTSQEIIDAFIAGGDAKDRARAFLSSGSRDAYKLLTSSEFVEACTANAEAMGIALPKDPFGEMTEEQMAEVDTLIEEAERLEDRAAHLRAQADALHEAYEYGQPKENH